MKRVIINFTDEQIAVIEDAITEYPYPTLSDFVRDCISRAFEVDGGQFPKSEFKRGAKKKVQS